MNRTDKWFYAGATVPLAILAVHSLAGLVGKADDWCYTNAGLSRQTLLLLTAAGIALLPHLGRFCIAMLKSFFSTRYLLIKAIAIVFFLACLVAISIPNFRKARGGGFAVGGAKDINTFRQNVSYGNLPNETDITYEGLFYDYYFNTIEDAQASVASESAASSTTGGLFTPACSWAMLRNPLTESLDRFVSVGLRSSLDTAHIQRKKLNLVVVLDISGSMNSGFHSYYYDRSLPENERNHIMEDPDRNDTKMQIAAKSLVAMLGHLKDDDRFGMVLFNNGSFVAKPLRAIGQTNMPAIKRHILDIEPWGGTFMEGGMRLGRSLLEGFENADPEQYENRIIFLTDAMPNIGMISRDGLFELAQTYASERVYTTFIGVGIDFQTELVEFVTKIRGANYYAIHSPWEFKKRLAKEFDYMVTPLLFNLRVTLHSDSFSIDEVYGSPEADQATGLLMKVNTLFPAPLEEDSVKGGIILLKLKRTNPGSDLRLTASYEDRSGKIYQTTVTAPAPSDAEEWCALRDVRKAVVLARLVTLMKEWLRSEREQPEGRPENQARSPNYWEHTSATLKVSQQMLDEMKRFREYFVEQSRLIDDPAMYRDKELLESIIEQGQSTASGTGQ